MDSERRFMARLHDLDARRSRARGGQRRLEHRGADARPDIGKGLARLEARVA